MAIDYLHDDLIIDTTVPTSNSYDIDAAGIDVLTFSIQLQQGGGAGQDHSILLRGTNFAIGGGFPAFAVKIPPSEIVEAQRKTLSVNSQNSVTHLFGEGDSLATLIFRDPPRFLRFTFSPDAGGLGSGGFFKAAVYGARKAG